MSKPRTHYEGDGCDPPHVITVVEPEDPDAVRDREGGNLTRPATRGKRKTSERREVYE